MTELEAIKIGKERAALLLAVDKGYRVTEQGQVISPRGTHLKFSRNHSGYFGFSVQFQGKPSTVRVHKLVAYLKFGEKSFEKGLVVRHLDGDKTNNSFSNIAIGTYSDNRQDIPQELRTAAAYKTASKRDYKDNSERMAKFWRERRAEFTKYCSMNRKRKVSHERGV